MTELENLLTQAPGACTLPTADRPLRVRAFAALFATSVRQVDRTSPTSATVTLPGALLNTARDLAARETACCSFFDFEVEPANDHARMTIRVPEQYADVLTALTSLAGSAR
ncbi:hypothetical protein AAIB33_03755 [Microbacterium sp. AZCO]|uniref:hypothetical protein n=1 Tax=Microbacterium sp. AZCO TaxID=3142976 RepID=UPI0031F43B94